MQESIIEFRYVMIQSTPWLQYRQRLVRLNNWGNVYHFDEWSEWTPVIVDQKATAELQYE